MSGEETGLLIAHHSLPVADPSSLISCHFTFTARAKGLAARYNGRW